MSELQIKQLVERLTDPDDEVRQEVAVEIALGESGERASPAIPVFLERLQSRAFTYHDRALAAWALPHLGADGSQIVPLLLRVLEETATQEEADQLRWCAAEAIRRLTTEVSVLAPLAKQCMGDTYWKCNLVGLFVAKQLIAENVELRKAFVSNAEPLSLSELDEIRDNAQQIISGLPEIE